MHQRIVRYAFDSWDFVVVELVVYGRWDKTTVKYRGAEFASIITRDALEAGVSFELPDGGSLHVVRSGNVIRNPKLTLNGTKLCFVTTDPFRRVRRASNAAYLMGGLEIFSFFWILVQRLGQLTLEEAIVPIGFGIIYLLSAVGIARKSQFATLFTALLVLLEIVAIVMTPLVGMPTSVRIGAVILRVIVFGFMARAVRAIHRIKKAEDNLEMTLAG